MGASLTDHQIAEFQRLYIEYYGVELTKDQALEKGLRLVRLLRVALEATAAEYGSEENLVESSLATMAGPKSV